MTKGAPPHAPAGEVRPWPYLSDNHRAESVREECREREMGRPLPGQSSLRRTKREGGPRGARREESYAPQRREAGLSLESRRALSDIGESAIPLRGMGAPRLSGRQLLTETTTGPAGVGAVNKDAATPTRLSGHLRQLVNSL
jgi:hypothetical protein